jgi:indolepyruvate ferredoxin oxidoreductase, alpha subunit
MQWRPSLQRLSGGPTLTLKHSPDPLKVDPFATVIDGCVGCGLCGENAHTTTLCPSFYRAELIPNPAWHDRLLNSVRHAFFRALQPASTLKQAHPQHELHGNQT